MKESRDLYYIAALIDGEVKNSSGKEKLIKEIEADSGLKFEYNIQSFIKSLINEKLIISSAPLKVKRKIERKFTS